MDPQQPPPRREVDLVDLFAGPGGLDVAATWLGLHSVGVEWDADACATREAAGLRTERSDVRDLGPSHFPGASILAAGPPCQTFTVAGSGVGRAAREHVVELMMRMDKGEDVRSEIDELEPRTGLVLQPLRWILDAEEADSPYTAVMLEQVPAVLPVWEALADVLGRHGYHTMVDVFRTEEFGVPQTRRRALLLAHRELRPLPPRRTHRAYRKGVPRAAGDQELRPWNTLGETLDRREDFTAISNYGTGGDPAARGRRTSGEPAATVTGKIGRVRIVGRDVAPLGARLTSPDAGRLQTFPHDYPWSGRNHGQQIGNAIPPRLGAHALAALVGKEWPSDLLDELVRQDWDATVRESNFDRLLDRIEPGSDYVGAGLFDV